MYCYHCGHKVTDNSLFCGQCGTNLQNISSSLSEKSINKEEHKGVILNTPNYVTTQETVLQEVTSKKTSIIAAVTMSVAVLCVLINIGGKLNGLDLINALFKTLSSNAIKYLDANEFFIMFLLLVSHVLISLFGSIAIISFIKGCKAGYSCITIIVASLMGILSCALAEWNAAAEITALVCGIITAILNSCIEESSNEYNLDLKDYSKDL